MFEKKMKTPELTFDNASGISWIYCGGEREKANKISCRKFIELWNNENIYKSTDVSPSNIVTAQGIQIFWE